MGYSLILVAWLLLLHRLFAIDAEVAALKHTRHPDMDLPCCPAACGVCVYGSARRKQPHFRDRHGNEYMKPAVIRRKPGKLLQKAGELLKGERSSTGSAEADGGLIYEKGKLKPVLLVDPAEAYWERDQWRAPAECTDSDCPCYQCKCCYTETIQCTVVDYCIATIVETITNYRTLSSTKKAQSVVSVTASLTFTLTDTVVFRSTFTYSTTISSPTLTTTISTQQTSSVSTIYLSTETDIDPINNATTTFTVTGPTITVSRDVISVINSIPATVTTRRSLTQTQTNTFTIPSFVPFTVYGKDRTVSPTISKTVHQTVTFDPVVFYSTPILAVSTESLTEITTETFTRVKTKCNDDVETIRVTPTKTKLLTIGTACPRPVTTCPGKEPCLCPGV